MRMVCRTFKPQEKTVMDQNGICFCGHDCSRCITYLATVNRDESLRKRAQKFYRDTFGINLALQDIHCLGGRSQQLFSLCGGCPWAKCCRERGIGACSDCKEYPCQKLSEYQKRFVNRCNQI